jgi:hypothetical protein
MAMQLPHKKYFCAPRNGVRSSGDCPRDCPGTVYYIDLPPKPPDTSNGCRKPLQTACTSASWTSRNANTIGSTSGEHPNGSKRETEAHGKLSQRRKVMCKVLVTQAPGEPASLDRHAELAAKKREIIRKITPAPNPPPPPEGVMVVWEDRCQIMR